MKRFAPQDGLSALDVIEEATHLLRCVPLSCAAKYLAGVVPFILGLTFFVADMSRGPYAAEHLPGAACGLVVAFAWMKTWQAAAADEALAYLEQRPAENLTWRGWWVLAGRQFPVHAFGLVLLPLAVIATLPGAWVYAYYQNLTVLGVSGGSGAHKAAWEQAKLWPGQNHGALGALSILGLAVLGNLAIAIYMVPMLVRTITGTERVFAQVGWNPLNTTFLAAVFALGFLALDPVMKALYVMRCFHGRSRRTGVDLLVQVRSALARSAPAVLLVAGVLCCDPGTLHAAAEAGEPTVVPGGQAAAFPARVEAAVDPANPHDSGVPAERILKVRRQELDAAIDQVLRKPDYIWREPPPSDGDGAASDFVKWVQRMIDSFGNWFRRLFEGDVEEGGGARSFGVGPDLVKWVFILAVVVLLALVALAIIRKRELADRARPGSAHVAKVPQLDREDVTADQLPEEEWLRLARELIGRGELRLGLRALFLGALAGLAARELVVLARHKSNRDYERELRRRGAPLAGAVATFADTRRVFEAVWYGDSVPSADDIARFEASVLTLTRRDSP